MDERTIRKKELIAIGALHRAELLVARQSLQEAARPESLARGVLQHARRALLGALGSKRAPDAGRSDRNTLLPMLEAGLALLPGRGTGLLRLLLSSGALSAVATGVVALLRRKKQAGTATSDAAS